MADKVLSTRISVELAELVDVVCGRLGLKKSFVVEQALREKMEDLLDAEDLNRDMGEASGFHDWKVVKAEASQLHPR